ncbi:hypothetical protein KB1253_20040 [Lactiplantibacillus plantarum]|nr:hypothetical protein KB1253_20040 [Lactiplantibacillus plantarum]
MVDCKINPNAVRINFTIYQKNKDFLSSVQMAKKEFDAADISMIERALDYRYKYSTY